MITGSEIALGVVIFLVSLFGSLALAVLVLVKLPPTYFCEQHSAAFAWADRRPVLRWTVIVLKNILGAVLVVVGILLSLPGIPGQGILTILIGVMLLNFPGKRRLERGLVSHPRVSRAVNGLRARFGKPPFVFEEKTNV